MFLHIWRPIGGQTTPSGLFPVKPTASFPDMSAHDTVTFYLHPTMRKQAERGNHNFVGKVGEVLTAAGFSVAFDNDDDIARLRAAARPGRSMFLMDPPVNDRGLTFRKTYIFPFWRIEKQAERWEWPVAHEEFYANAKDPRKAANFYRFWRERLFDNAPRDARRDGFVLVPLQGRLLQHRSFQTCSPIDMVRTVIAQESKLQIVVTLHPTETYATDELQALENLVAAHDRVFMRTGDMAQYLQNCDYIVTQNSSVGFMGYFFGKPLILFGKADFHHIALSIDQMGVAAAFEAASYHQPDYAAYLHWFLQQRSINAGRPEAKNKIRSVLRGHGWPV